MTSGRYRRHPAAVWRATTHFLVVAVPPSAPTRVVGSAGAVWQALSSPKQVAELVAELGVLTAADPAVIEHDIRVLLDRLASLGLIEEMEENEVSA